MLSEESGGAQDGDDTKQRDAEEAPEADVITALESTPEVAKLQDAFKDKADELVKLNGFMTQARRTIASFVSLAVETDNDEDLVRAMQDSAAGKVKIDGKKEPRGR